MVQVHWLPFLYTHQMVLQEVCSPRHLIKLSWNLCFKSNLKNKMHIPFEDRPQLLISFNPYSPVFK